MNNMDNKIYENVKNKIYENVKKEELMYENMVERCKQYYINVCKIGHGINIIEPLYNYCNIFNSNILNIDNDSYIFEFNKKNTIFRKNIINMENKNIFNYGSLGSEFNIEYLEHNFTFNNKLKNKNNIVVIENYYHKTYGLSMKNEDNINFNSEFLFFCRNNYD